MFGLALAVVALAASAAASGYIDGREYVYKYSGIIYTGFPRIKPQESGYAFSARVRIQPEGDSALVQFEQTQRAPFNGEFEDVSRADHAFADLPPHAESLTRPFRVHRKNGIVTHFEVSRDEPSFSVNLKRGIASIFNLNFDHAESEVSADEDNEIRRPVPDAHYYKVYEDSPVGECETAYVIEHHPFDHTDNIVLNVTKVRNFHKCKSRPNQVYSVFHGHDCGEVDHEKSHTLHGNAQYHYSIRGDRHHYVVEKIRTESDVAYTPYPLEGQTVSTIVKRSLELVEEKPVSEPIEISGDLVDVTSLVYDFDFQRDFKDPIDLKKPHYLYHLTGRKVPISDIKQQVEELVDVYNDETYLAKIKDKDFPAKFVELLRSVASVGYDEIQELYTTYVDSPSTESSEKRSLYRNLFMDTLGNLGTNPAFLFGKYLIDNSKVQPHEAFLFIKQLQFQLKETSEVLLDNVQELCDSENVKKNTFVHIACVNTLSNIVFDHCVARYHPEGIHHEGKNVCPYDAAVKYFNYIAKLYDESPIGNLKMNYLKAAGNIGVEEALPYLEPYIEGRGSFHRIDRENAIWALYHVGHRNPEKVRALVIPLLFNRTENYELRLASFIYLLYMQPQLYEIEGVARALKTEPDDQVRSYIYTTFKSLVNSTHKCDRKLSKYAAYALRILEDVQDEFEGYDFSYSKHHYSSGYDPNYDIGGSTYFAYFASDTGYIPHSMYLGFENFIGGKSLDFFAMGLKQYGLEKLFDKFFGPEGSFGKRSIFDVFKKHSKRDVSDARKELNEIKEKLKFPVYDYEDIKGEVFFTYMGNLLSSYQFEESDFDQFFKEGRFVIPNIPAALQKIPAFVYQRFMLSVDKLYVLPSESGIPLLFDYKQPLYYYHRNKESSFRVEPGFFAEDRGGQFPDHVKVETDGHFALDCNLVAYTGVVIPFDQVIFGAGINKRSTASLPLKLKLDLTVKDKKLKLHRIPIAPHEIYHFNYEPFTFTDSYGNTVPQVLEKGYKPVNREHRHEVERHFFHDALGLGFDVRADFENEFNDFGSWVDFFLKKNFRENAYYIFTNPNFEPYHIDVQFSLAEQHATRERFHSISLYDIQVETEFSYHSFDSDWIIPHFPEEGFVDLGDQKTAGLGHFSTCALKANFLARGDKERKAHAVLSWTRDFTGTFNKVNFFYERTPFTRSETEDLKICGSSYVQYPIYDQEKAAFKKDTVDMDHTVRTGLKVHFGKNCNADQKIDVKGLITTSEEQRELERRREEPDTFGHSNLYSHYYHQCMKEHERGIHHNPGCGAYQGLTMTNHKYSLHIKHENLSPGFLNRTYLLDRILKYKFYTHSDHDEIDVHNPVDEVLIEANFSYNLPVADIRVHKPLSNSNYYNVYFPNYRGFKSGFGIEDLLAKKTFRDLSCYIEADQVVTFDGYEYNLPHTDCFKVLAKDCSPKEYFTILTAKINHPKYHQTLKMFLGDHTYEVGPLSDDSDIVVRLDGKQVTLDIDEPHFVKEGDEVLFYIKYKGFYYTLHSVKYGLIVEYEGSEIFVQLSPYYQAKLCGLCGNFNRQKNDGYSTAEGCHYEDEKAYTYAYSIPSETCSVPRPEPICPA